MKVVFKAVMKCSYIRKVTQFQQNLFTNQSIVSGDSGGSDDYFVLPQKQMNAYNTVKLPTNRNSAAAAGILGKKTFFMPQKSFVQRMTTKMIGF